MTTVMYLLRQPQSLESLALDKLPVWIRLEAKKMMSTISELLQHDALKADAVLSRRIEIIGERLECNVPRMSHDALLSKTIVELYHLLEKTKMRKIGKMVETLFTSKLTSMSLSFTQLKMFRDSLCNKSHMLTGLIRLDLNHDPYHNTYRYYTADMETDIIQLLKELHNLKQLTIEYVCTDNILRCLVNNCTLIEKLNLSSSVRIDDNSIDILTELSHLTNINLEGTKVLCRGIETILLSCKNIDHIGVSCFTFKEREKISCVLNQFASSKDNAERMFKLKTYKSGCDTFEELETTFRMCPLIQILTVQASSYSRPSNVMAIISLRNLLELTLVGYDFYDGQVKEALRAIGCNLERLHFTGVKQMDLNALIDISQMCPNLQSLSLESCTFIDQTTMPAKKFDIPSFRNLKKLTLDMETSSYIQESLRDLTGQKVKLLHEPVFFLLSNCLNVEFIEFNRSGIIMKLIMDILDNNPLSHLKELKIVQSSKILPPTAKLCRHYREVIDRITANCINHPEVMHVLAPEKIACVLTFNC